MATIAINARDIIVGLCEGMIANFGTCEAPQCSLFVGLIDD